MRIARGSLLVLVPLLLPLARGSLTAAEAGPPAVTVPSVRGLSVAAAEHRLGRVGLHARPIGPADGTGRRVVTAQHPPARARVRRGAQVRVTFTWIRSGEARPGGRDAPAHVRVPVVIGLRAGVALARLQRSGLDARLVSGTRQRFVVGQHPQGGRVVRRGTLVRITTRR